MKENDNEELSIEKVMLVFVIIISTILFFVIKYPQPTTKVNKVVIEGHTYLVMKVGSGTEGATYNTVHDENCVCKHR